MRDVRPGILLVGFAPFLYVAWKCFSGLPALEVPVSCATFSLAVALAFLYLWSPRFGLVLSWVGYGALLVTLMVTVTDGRLGSTASDVALGTLVAVPSVTLVVFAHPDQGPGARIVGLQLAFLVSLVLLAAVQNLSGSNDSITSTGLVRSFFAVIGLQLEGLAALLAGAVPGSLPLASLNDPVFVSLAGLALLATVVSIVRPVTGRDVELPAVSRAARTSGAEVNEELSELSPRFRELLAGASPPEGAPPGSFPGVIALGWAAVAAATFVVLVYTVAAWALLDTALGTLAAIAILVTIFSRPLHRKLRREEEDASSGSPAFLGGRAPEN